VGHDGGAGDQRFSGAKVFAERPGALDVVHELVTSFSAAVDFEVDHSTVVATLVLLISESLLGVRFETGVGDALDLGVSFEELGDLHGVVGLSLDAETEGLGSLELVEGDLGSHDVTEDVLDEADLVIEFLGAGGEGATDGDVVTVVELGGGVEDDINAVVHTAADVGSGEGAVSDVNEVLGLGEVGDGLEISEVEGGVGGRFGEEDLGVGLDGGFDFLEVGHIDEGEFHTHLGEEDTAGAVGTTVRAVGDDGVVTSLHQGGEEGGGGGHTSVEDAGLEAVFGGGDAFLEGLDGGVGRAGVGETLLAVAVDGVLDEGGGLVDGGEDGTSFAIRGNTSVDHTGGEVDGVVVPGTGLGGGVGGDDGLEALSELGSHLDFFFN